MDPFSIIVGVGSLIDLSIKLGKSLKAVHEAVACFEEDIGFLLREIDNLGSVNKSIEHLYRTEASNLSRRLGSETPSQELEVWQNTVKTLQSCSETAQKLQSVLDVITGKNGTKVTGLRDSIKKQLRKQAKDGELDQIRIKLSTHRESLNISLTLLNIIYTQRASQDIQKFGFQLHRQIASLQTRLPLANADTLHDSFQSATAVASTLRLNRYFDTPKTLSSIYTGRQSHLDTLKQAFDASYSSPGNSPTQKRFVVYGLGGSGKTQFCCKFASEYKQRFWGVFTVDASSPVNAQQSFIAIAKACGAAPNERAAKSWLSSSDRPWLLIIDNADDAKLEVEKYFPEGELGFTLITTRNPSVKMHGTIGERFYHFDRLDDGEASDLLLKAAEHYEPRTPSIMQLALAIIKKLGALPLAIVHAGNAIKARYCELTNYIPTFERTWELVRQDQSLADEDEDDEFMKVYSSYEIVFRGLEALKSRRYRDAVQLLQLFSFLHHEHVPFRLLIATVEHPRIQREADAQDMKDQNATREGSSSLLQTRFWLKIFRNVVESGMKKTFELRYPVIVPTFVRDMEITTNMDDCTLRLRGALHCLTELSLLTHYEASDSYSMHPLVHTWVRDRRKMRTRTQAVWCEAARQTISRCILLPPLGFLVDRDTDLVRRLLPHIIAVTEFQHKIEREFTRNRQRRKRPWPALLPQTSPWTAIFLAKSAFVYFECGELGESENCLRKVLDFNRTHLGETHASTERVIVALHEVLWHQGRVNEAAQLTEQALQRYLQALGRDHTQTLIAKRRLGELRRQQGRFAESVELLTEAKTGLEHQLPDPDPETCQTLWELGATLRSCYCFEEALRYSEQAVAGLKLCLGDTNVLTLFAIEELAATYEGLSTVYTKSEPELSRNYLETAKSYATLVLEQRVKQIGERQLSTRNAQGILARIIAAMGELDEAETLYSTLVPMVTRHLGSDHLGLLTHRNAYAKLLILQKRYDEAETILLDTSTLERWKTVRFVGDHPDRWDALWTLVKCYEEQGKIDRSLAIDNELLDAMGEIRKGRAQTETSSKFWNMVLSKKDELLVLRGSGTGGSSETVAPNPPSGASEVAAAYSNVQARSRDTGRIAIPGSGDLRLRGSAR